MFLQAIRCFLAGEIILGCLQGTIRFFEFYSLALCLSPQRYQDGLLGSNEQLTVQQRYSARYVSPSDLEERGGAGDASRGSYVARWGRLVLPLRLDCGGGGGREGKSCCCRCPPLRTMSKFILGSLWVVCM